MRSAITDKDSPFFHDSSCGNQGPGFPHKIQVRPPPSPAVEALLVKYKERCYAALESSLKFAMASIFSGPRILEDENLQTHKRRLTFCQSCKKKKNCTLENICCLGGLHYFVTHIRQKKNRVGERDPEQCIMNEEGKCII